MIEDWSFSTRNERMMGRSVDSTNSFTRVATTSKARLRLVGQSRQRSNPDPRLVNPTQRRRLGWGAKVVLSLAIIVVSTLAFADSTRYELFPDPEVKQTTTNKVASAYVVDKKANQFWICTARFNFVNAATNGGDCIVLPAAIGRPSLTEEYRIYPVAGDAMPSMLLPVIWFIEPSTGDVQFCAPRHPGGCVQMKLPE
jgi:hypothetical protein